MKRVKNITIILGITLALISLGYILFLILRTNTGPGPVPSPSQSPSPSPSPSPVPNSSQSPVPNPVPSPSQENTNPIGDFYDCCRPACAKYFFQNKELTYSCDKSGQTQVPRPTNPDFPNKNVCYKDQSPLSNSIAQCSESTLPKIKAGNILYAYGNYISTNANEDDQCGQCRTITLDNTGATKASVETIQLKLIGHKPKDHSSNSINGYRIIVPGGGGGSHLLGCKYAQPGLYQETVCGIDGTNGDPNVCQYSEGGLQTPTACNNLNPEEQDSCHKIHIDIFRNYKLYGRTSKKHIIVKSDEEDDNCNIFNSFMNIES